MRLHPALQNLRLMVEWVPDPEKHVSQCFNDSLSFLVGFWAGPFTGSLKMLSEVDLNEI